MIDSRDFKELLTDFDYVTLLKDCEIVQQLGYFTSLNALFTDLIAKIADFAPIALGLGLARNMQTHSRVMQEFILRQSENSGAERNFCL